MLSPSLPPHIRKHSSANFVWDRPMQSSDLRDDELRGLIILLAEPLPLEDSERILISFFAPQDHDTLAMTFRFSHFGPIRVACAPNTNPNCASLPKPEPNITAAIQGVELWIQIILRFPFPQELNSFATASHVWQQSLNAFATMIMLGQRETVIPPSIQLRVAQRGGFGQSFLRQATKDLIACQSGSLPNCSTLFANLDRYGSDLSGMRAQLHLIENEAADLYFSPMILEVSGLKSAPRSELEDAIQKMLNLREQLQMASSLDEETMIKQGLAAIRRQVLPQTQ